MMSAAFFWPMPWMYWSAIKTRLLVGIFTPAIRATDFSPVANPFGTAVLSLSRASVRKREHDALPLGLLGARHRLELSDLDTGLLRIQLGFVNRSYALARFFVTFLAAFPPRLATFPLEPFAAGLMVFLAAFLAVFLDGFLATLGAPFPAFLAGLATFRAGFLAAFWAVLVS